MLFSSFLEKGASSHLQIRGWCWSNWHSGLRTQWCPTTVRGCCLYYQRVDLRPACAQCCHREKQITYMVKSVDQCAENLLLCRIKGGSWRPISQWPKFPSLAKYELCHFFVEGSGCQRHWNRCSFASSIEEATVWTFEKRHGLDRQLLCSLLAQSAEATHPTVEDIFERLDLKLVCNLCCVRVKETTFTLKPLHHQCPKKLPCLSSQPIDTLVTMFSTRNVASLWRVLDVQKMETAAHMPEATKRL